MFRRNALENLVAARADAWWNADQSPAGVLKRIRLLSGDRTPELLNGRVRVIK